MNPTLVNIFLVIILSIAVGVAALYIYKSKKAGAACIGCPYAKECASKKKCDSQNNQGGCCH
jgi:hypothetical protein